MNFEWTFYPLINLQHHALVIWKVLVHWIVQIFQMLTHSILPNQKITNSSTSLFRRVFKIRKLQNSTQLQLTCFPKFSFTSETQILLATNLANLFSFKWQAYLFYFWKKICQRLKPLFVSSLFFQVKLMYHEESR